MGMPEEDITRTQGVVNIEALYETTEVLGDVLKGILNPIHGVFFSWNSILSWMSDLN
jgi:hypothetical protein